MPGDTKNAASSVACCSFVAVTKPAPHPGTFDPAAHLRATRPRYRYEDEYINPVYFRNRSQPASFHTTSLHIMSAEDVAAAPAAPAPAATATEQPEVTPADTPEVGDKRKPDEEAR